MGNERDKKAILYTIADPYVEKLKKVDNRVQNNYRGQRLYFKSDLSVAGSDGSVRYYVPLSSAKEKQLGINNRTIYKLFGNREKSDFLGVLHINNMIPVPNNMTKPWSPDKAIDERYTMLVVKQAKCIYDNVNEINNSCKLLYASKTDQLDRDFFRENRQEVMLYKRLMPEVKDLEPISLNVLNCDKQKDEQQVRKGDMGFERG